MYLARRPIPSVNANSVQIVKMCEAFGRLGHQVTLVCHRGDDQPGSVFSRYGVSPTFQIDTLPAHGRFLEKWRYLVELVGSTRRNDADLLFGRDIWSLVALARLGRPIVYEAHIIPPVGSFRWRLLSWLFARPNFARLVCVTSTLADLYKEQFPALAGKSVLVVPNGAAPPVDAGQLPTWPGREDKLQIGFVGRPFPGKGIEAVVEAAGVLREMDFHVVGANERDLDWIDGERPSNLHFHGYQQHGALGRFYNRFDVAVAPYGSTVMNASGMESAAITSPLKLIEYMAAGLPAVVSDLPGVGDILGDSGAALLVPAGDNQAFIDALRDLQDPGLRRRLGQAAHDEYRKRLTAEARARTVLADLPLQHGAAGEAGAASQSVADLLAAAQPHRSGNHK